MEKLFGVWSYCDPYDDFRSIRGDAMRLGVEHQTNYNIIAHLSSK